jgi:molecular chaperone GrpE
MTEERRGAPGREPEVKVVDRRRFSQDGEPIDPGPAEPGQGSAERQPSQQERGVLPAPDERDETIESQAKRIDDLTRAYAALVEDNKAFRSRLERENDRVVDAERAGLAQVLLEAADDLERALAAVRGAEAQSDAMRTLVEGIRLSLGALHKRIAEMGAQKIPVVGRRFDPRVAEAVDTVAVGDAAQDNVMLHEVRPGYRIGDRVLRPARVRVGQLAQA